MLFNPFFLLCGNEADANYLYGHWLSVRMDKELFLRPLLGRSILCDCDRGLGCHIHTLLRILDRAFPPPGACPPHFGFVDAATHLEPAPFPAVKVPLREVCRDELSESDDSGTEVQVVIPLSKPGDISRVDETRRGSFNALHFSGERPAWPVAWVSLVMAVRGLGTMIFWEIFSGVASLTSAFEAEGWSVGPPLDILYCPDFDLLNPIFLGIVLGLIFERRIRVLHVGPPCSSY